MRRILLLLLMFLAMPAPAAVTLTFYSKELGDSFPHAFILVTGATDADPAHRVDANYGFTAKSVTPAILMGRSTARSWASRTAISATARRT